MRVLIAISLAACGGGGGAGAGDDGPGGTDGPQISDGPMADAPGGVGEPANLAGITLRHNEIRAMVQTATPLPALEWDPALAATAAAWVAMCRDQEIPAGLIDHNPGRSTGHPYYVGENAFGSTQPVTPPFVVDEWAKEQVNYDYPANTCPRGNKICGHYTQIVWRDTRKVGCAIGDCPGLQYRHTVVCDYGPGGNVNSDLPY